MTEEEEPAFAQAVKAALESALEVAQAQTSTIKIMREMLNLHQSLIELLQQERSAAAGIDPTTSDEWRTKIGQLEANVQRLDEQSEAMQHMFALRHMTGKSVAEKLSVIKGGKGPRDDLPST